MALTFSISKENMINKNDKLSDATKSYAKPELERLTSKNLPHATGSIVTSYLRPTFFGLEREFDEIFRALGSSTVARSSYPPYNIIKDGEFDYIVEVAVAGFEKSELSVQTEDGRLYITGGASSEASSESDENVLYRGIAKRKFSLNFFIADTIEIVSAELKDGLLNIKLHNNVPENKKHRLITIQ